MTDGDDPWASFQVSLLLVATMLAIVCSVCLILTALRPYIGLGMSGADLAPRTAVAN